MLPTVITRNGAAYKWWDRLPRRSDLRDIDLYRRGRHLHDRLWDTGHTMLGSRRGRTLYRLATTIVRDDIPGALVDCGVWNGGSTILMTAAAPDREVWAFDSFEGLPTPSSVDGEASFQYAGDCVGSEAKLRAGIAEHGDPDRLHVRPGWFQDTIPAAAEEIGPIAVLHCDGDWYESVRLTLAVLYPLVVPGGFVVIDDYGTWPGARRATDEHRAAAGEQSRLRKIDHTGCYWRKRSLVR